MPSHVHMLISVPPKYSVAELIGFMKGQSHHKSSRSPSQPLFSVPHHTTSLAVFDLN